MSLTACFSNDHYARTSSPPSGLHISRSITAVTSDSAASYPTSVVVSSNPSFDSSAGLQLFVDLLSYLL